MSRAAAAILELARRKTEALHQYVPMSSEHNNQLAFHQSRSMIRLAMGGSGSGKTQTVAAEVAAAMTGQSFPWMGNVYPKPPIHVWIIKQRLVTNVHTDPILTKLLFGEEGYDPSLDNGELDAEGDDMAGRVHRDPFIPVRLQFDGGGYNRHDRTCVLRNGSTFQLKSAEQDVVAFASEGVNIIWIDEPINSKAWSEIQYRIIRRKGAKVMFSLTPADLGVGYLDDLLHNDKVSKKTGVRRVSAHYLHTEENKYLSPEELQAVIDDTPRDLVETRLHGQMLHLSGLVYSNWDNWVQPFDIPEDWTHYVVHDPGVSNPAATLWAAVNPRGDIYLYNCDYEDGKHRNLRELCNTLLAKSVGRYIYRWYIDPFAAAQRIPTPDDQVNERTLQQMYRECGVPMVLGPRQQDQAGRRQRVYNTMLYVDKQSNTPCVYAFDTPEMAPLRKELRMYRWKVNKSREEINEADEPHRKHDHLMYCMETMCSLRLKHQPTARAVLHNFGGFDDIYRETAAEWNSFGRENVQYVRAA